MVNLGIGLLIHKERERELERWLELRRRIEPPPVDACAPTREVRITRRQRPAGATS